MDGWAQFLNTEVSGLMTCVRGPLNGDFPIKFDFVFTDAPDGFTATNVLKLVTIIRGLSP